MIFSDVKSYINGLRMGFIIYRRRHSGCSRFEAITKCRVVLPNNKLDNKEDYLRQFKIICHNIKCIETEHFIYPFDGNIVRVFQPLYVGLSSMTVDNQVVIESSLESIKNKILKGNNDSFIKRQIEIINYLCEFANNLDREHPTYNVRELLDRKPKTLCEAIQKILFYNGLFWQMNHTHIGLGRLDLILLPYYLGDLNASRQTEDSAKGLLREMIEILGKQTKEKSLTLIGDTGQYIMLGGIDCNGCTVNNQLTIAFLEIMATMNIADPKLILRVNDNTAQIVWEKAIECILKGTGSPLIMNERPIMRSMVKFGYRKEDVWNVGTSACWEPLIIGKSSDQNNPFPSAVPIKSLNEVICSNDIFESFDDLKNAFFELFAKELESIVTEKNFDCSPLFTLFYDDCISKERDFSEKGTIYSNHGAQIVSLPNTVNALLNIKEFVFEKHLLTISDCKNAIVNNFENMDDIRHLLLSNEKKYGSTNSEVVDLTNEIMTFAGKVFENIFWKGEKVKIGFSSPNYVFYAKNCQASLDGRKLGDPFAVHISPLSSEIDITEILDFASLLNYEGNRINGNVVDFIIPSSYRKQPVKLISIIKNACAKGIFELQLNVLDKKTLIDAKLHPEKYPNLIVRVWGFSAYFNDLPEDFKDNLIQRAELYETV